MRAARPGVVHEDLWEVHSALDGGQLQAQHVTVAAQTVHGLQGRGTHLTTTTIKLLNIKHKLVLCYLYAQCISAKHFNF